MANLSNRQSSAQPASGRATVAHLGRAQQPQPTPISSRALVGQIGIGRRYAGHGSLLTAPQLHLPLPPLPDFMQLRAQAQQLEQQVKQRVAATQPPYHPSPLLTPTEKRLRAQDKLREQQRLSRERARIRQQVLDEFNQTIQGNALYQPSFLRKPIVSLAPKPEAGPDCFMPNSFWRTQAPEWWNCCNTVKSMFINRKDIGKEPTSRFYIVRENNKSLKGVKNANKALGKLDEYMALHRPVMAGVTHTFGMQIQSKNGTSRPLNEGTTDHFIAIVGVGEEKGRKYYRFFDVGTVDVDRGTSKLNKLYLEKSGFYVGHSQATGKEYTLSQLRF